MYKRAEILPVIRRGLENGDCLGVAIRNSGLKSPYTLALWRKRWPRIDHYIIACIDKSKTRRDSAVLDSLFKQAAIVGNPTCIAIYLKYHMGWKEAYDGPPINVFTQIWNGAISKSKQVNESGRIIREPLA
jgi:hypothetical protein